MKAGEALQPRWGGGGGSWVEGRSTCSKAQRQEGAWPSRDLKAGAGWSGGL